MTLLVKQLVNYDKGEHPLYWYHWIAIYLIIGAGVIFTIIPEKPWWLWITMFLLFGIGWLMFVVLPHKEDKYAKIKKKEG
jgi:lipoprotein signal peptidase